MYWFLVSREGGGGGRFTFFERKLVDAFFFLTLVFCFVCVFFVQPTERSKKRTIYTFVKYR